MDKHSIEVEINNKNVGFGHINADNDEEAVEIVESSLKRIGNSVLKPTKAVISHPEEYEFNDPDNAYGKIPEQIARATKWYQEEEPLEFTEDAEFFNSRPTHKRRRT